MQYIRLENITKSYTTKSTDIIIDHAERPTKTRTVFSGLNLAFPVGRLSVIVGRSGCGKSTLLHMLSGKEQPDSGVISMPEGFRTSILTPEPYVITWTSVLRNVAMAAGAGRTPEERMKTAQQLVELVKLTEFADLTPLELSTGMKQRLGIARVLASQSQVLLMDEPFASLDFITRGELQQELLKIQQSMNKTIILVTHQLEEALLLAQQIIVMHTDGTPEVFDMSGLSYPRDLSQPELAALKEAITDACRSE